MGVCGAAAGLRVRLAVRRGAARLAHQREGRRRAQYNQQSRGGHPAHGLIAVYVVRADAAR
jgi:hypothetical protein